MRNAPLKGLFLDLDGTLADSLGVMREVYDQFLREQGCCGSDREFNDLNGPPIAEIVALLKRRYQLTPAADTLAERYDRLVIEAYRNVGQMPGAFPAIRAAVARGWPLAVVTSNGSALGRSWMDRTGLGEFVTVVVAREAVLRGKPEPDLYLRALQETGCLAEHSIAVEDSIQGAAAALKAGLQTYLVGARPDARITGAGSLASLNVLAARISDGTI